MKQYITKKQWDELNVEKKKLFCKFFNWNYKIYEKFQGYDEIGIGQMIEFLGDDWYKNREIFVGDRDEIYYVGKDEFCDALWEVVKYNLKNRPLTLSI